MFAIAPGAGAMGAAVFAYDWASTPLGRIETWPPELRSAVCLVLESRFPQALVWGPHLVTIYNDAFAPILRAKPDTLGRNFAVIWAEVWGQLSPLVDRAFAGKSTFIEDHALELERGGERETAWFTFCFSPVRLADGTVAGMLDTVIETTEAVRARQTAEVLRDELAHRLKNTMAMVQSIAQRTLRDVTERDAVEAFHKRIVALGRAHDALAQGSWQNASLATLAEALLATHGERFDVSGPAIALGSSAALRLSLILHELATNATKYGALSIPEGRVALHWHIEPSAKGEMLALCWRERVGPPVDPPRRTGFGTRLIDMGLMGGGRVERRYPPSGVEVDLRVPLADLDER
ncbi:sensor histidine kinase [Sphingomonas sp. MMS12-HWE2-04]|uniref:sensor histidine kinase n=1 Tax=Sphingomonas sp. MMS12-HWE2-04 TaxID=3234199 RepID=UPI00384A69A5